MAEKHQMEVLSGTQRHVNCLIKVSNVSAI